MSVFATQKHRETFVVPIEAERSSRSHRRRSTFVPARAGGSRVWPIVVGAALVGNFAAAISFATGLAR